jgi:hypothetical protein
VGSAHKPDRFGGLIGILVFLGGVAMLVATFRLAYGMFSVSPAEAMNSAAGKPADLVRSGETFIGLLQRVILLLVMCWVSSIVANRGVKLYHASRVSLAAPPDPIEI